MSILQRLLISPNGSYRHHKKVLQVFTIIGTIFAVLILLAASKTSTGADASQCRSIYMYPSYARVTGFDTSHTKFALKYNLYLYREQGKDKVPDQNNELSTLDGIPVLFIPGNAGSYKQARSIAAETSNVYFHNQHDESYKGKNFDFFSAHFNEDFTAFHGRTMLDQAEYLNDAIKFILSLYSKQKNPPTSVIIIGHSMGGVVSRVMLTLPNYVEGSINTIITLAAPHAAAPATFDGDIMQTYSAIDKFWRAGFYHNETSVAKTRLENLSLVSITGGLSDTILPADYTTLAGLIPPSHGFTVYTTGIPGVWTPIDHLAIVWCDQLRKVVASTLFDIVDPVSPFRTIPLEDRMEKFHERLLTGFENNVSRNLIDKESPFLLKIPSDQLLIEELSTSINSHKSSKFHAVKIPSDKPVSLSFLSTSKPTLYDSTSQKLSLQLCSQIKGDSSTTLLANTDENSDSDEEQVKFECVDISTKVTTVPNPSTESLQDSSIGGNASPYYAVQLNSEILANYTYIISHETDSTNSDDYFAALSTTQESEHSFKIKASVLDLFIGTSFTVPDKSLVKDITIENAWSSLLSYKLHASIKEDNPLFKPFLRQWIEDPYETKWHINLEEPKSITFHGISPYTPFQLSHNPVHLQLWSSPSNTNVKFTIKIDLFESLKLLVLRYRLAVASLPVFVIILVLFIQFNNFFDSGNFISFEEGLVKLSSRTPLVLIALSLLTPLASGPFFHWAFYLFDPIAKTDPSELIDAHVNPYFLGLQEKFLFFLGPFFYLIALSVVHIVLIVIKLFLSVSPLISSLLQKIWKQSKKSESTLQTSSSSDNTIESIKSRRLVGSLLLVVLVIFFIPYQFAYVVVTLVQVTVAIKTHLQSLRPLDSKEKVDLKTTNLANFNLSITVLMLWLIPVNIPVLVVFFHNFAVRWETPFSSHHNILAILPIILFVSKNVQGEFPLQSQNQSQKRISALIISYFAFFVLVYGVRHLYWLHYLMNFLSAWLFLLSFWK